MGTHGVTDNRKAVDVFMRTKIGNQISQCFFADSFFYCRDTLIVQFGFFMEKKIESIKGIFLAEGSFQQLKLFAMHAITVKTQYGLRSTTKLVIVQFSQLIFEVMVGHLSGANVRR